MKSGVQSGFNAKLQHALCNTVWAAGCKSWYIAESGKIVNNWAGFTFTYRRMTSRFDVVNYEALSDKGVARQRESEFEPAMPSQYAPVPA